MNTSTGRARQGWPAVLPCLLAAAVGCTAPVEPLLPAPPPPARSGLFPFQGPFSDAGGGGGWGYIDRSGGVRIAPRYSTAGPFRDGLACVSIGGSFGFIDTQGTPVIPLDLLGCGPFSGGLAPAQRGEGWGFVDARGAWVVAPSLPYRSELSEGLAVIFTARGMSYLNARGRRAFPGEFEVAGPFSEGRAPVVVGKQLGYIDRSGQIRIAPTWPFDRVTALTEEVFFHDGRAAVALGCKHKYFEGRNEVDPSNYPLRDPRWAKLSVETASCSTGYLDETGALRVPAELASGDRYSEGLAVVRRRGARGVEYIDVQGQTAVPGLFDSAGPFSEGRAFVQVEQQPLLIDREGHRWPLPEGFRWGSPFDDGLARVEGEAGWGYLNLEGRLVWAQRSNLMGPKAPTVTDYGRVLLRPIHNRVLSAEPRLTAALESKLPALTACFERALLVDPQTAARINLEWEISPSGLVAAPRFVGGSGAAERIRPCVLKALANTRFPTLPAGKPRRVGYSLWLAAY